jgi:hypothetical protein
MKWIKLRQQKKKLRSYRETIGNAVKNVRNEGVKMEIS